MAALLSGGIRHGHEALGEEVSALALRIERALTPENEGAELALDVVVGRVDAVVINKGPESGGMSQDVGAGTGDVTELGIDGG